MSPFTHTGPAQTAAPTRRDRERKTMRRARHGMRTAGREYRISRTAVFVVALALVAAAGAAGADARENEADPADDETHVIDVAPSVHRVLALEGDPESGARVYRTCAVCHLADGGGRPDGTFPQLAGQHREVIVKQLVDVREGRRHNPVMGPWAEALVDDRDVADVAAYIAKLPAPLTPEPPPDAADAPTGTNGAALYHRDCRPCHGARGQGDAERFVPMLAGQHERYLLRQIRAIAGGRRRNAHPAMERIVERYTDAELQAVVRHAVGLPGPERGP